MTDVTPLAGSTPIRLYSKQYNWKYVAGQSGNVNMAPTAGLVVAATVKQLSFVTLAGGAALNVSPAVQQLATVNQSAITTLTAAAKANQLAGVSQHATAAMLVSTLGQVVSSVSMSAAGSLLPIGGIIYTGSVSFSAGAAMTVAGAPGPLGVVPMSATAGMTLAGGVQQVSAVSQSATAGMTTSGSNTEVAVVTFASSTSLNLATIRTVFGTPVTLAPTASMSVTAFLIQGGIGTVMTGTAKLTVSGKTTQVATVHPTATAALTVATQVTQVGGVTLKPTARLTVAGSTQLVAQVSLVGTTSMMVVPSVAVIITHQAFASMRVIAAPVQIGAAVAMAPRAALHVAPQMTGQVSMAAHAGMTVSSFVWHNAAVGNFAPTAKLTVGGISTYVPVSGVVLLAPQTGLTIAAVTRPPSSVHLSAAASMRVMAGAHTVLAQVVLSSGARLYVVGSLSTPPQVSLSANSLMLVESYEAPRVPTLEEQILGVIDLDPILLGATGYVDNVYASRLVSDSE